MRGRNYRRSFGESTGIYRSTDGGDSWDELTEGLPLGEDAGRIGIDIAKSNPDVLYAFYDMPNEARVYRSADGGDFWIRKNDGVLENMNRGFGWYFGQTRVDPVNENRVFVLGVVSYRSEDGGNNWTNLDDLGPIHVDHHALVIDEFSGMCVEGNDGGLYTSFNYGTSWAKINNLPITQFYDIEVDYLNPHRIYGGTQDNNTVRTYSGEIDDWHALLGGDGFYTLVDYTNPNIIYAEYQWGNLFKSTNGGNYFDYIAGPMENDRTNWSSPLVMHPQEPSVLYFGTYRVWKSINWGSSWTAVSGDLTDGDDGSNFHTVTTLAISPVNPNIVIAGTDDAHVHVSEDGGAFWSEISEGLPNRWITRVAADPFDANTIYCTVSGFRWDEPEAHVFKSVDLGETWTNVSGNLPDIPMNVIVLDPEIPGRMVVGSDAGMFYTETGGGYWVGISEGLANVPVTALKIHNPTRTLVAGTFGLSAYKINLDDLTVGLDDQDESDFNVSSMEIYPNPSSGILNIKYQITVGNWQLGIGKNVDLSIYNMNGKKIKTLVNEAQGIGEYIIQIDGTDLPAGIYFCKLSAGSTQVASKKLIIN